MSKCARLIAKARLWWRGKPKPVEKPVELPEDVKNAVKANDEAVHRAQERLHKMSETEMPDLSALIDDVVGRARGARRNAEKQVQRAGKSSRN